MQSSSSCSCTCACAADFDVQQLLDQHGKGKVLPAIVEQVASGSFIRLTLLEGFHSVAVNLCGIQVSMELSL